MSAGLRTQIREIINPQLRGIEVGPSYNPIAPKREGYDVTVVDHAPAEMLRHKYKDMPVDTNLIEKVDVIWSDGDLISCFPETDHESFHYIVAPHFIEHVPDLVSFLLDCEKLLVTDGLIILLIPDQRFCFDLFQPTTDAAELVNRHIKRSARHGFTTHYRHLTQSVFADGMHAWDQQPIGQYSWTGHVSPEAVELAKEYARSSIYIDTHGQYLTPCSFWSIIEEFRYLDLTSVCVHLISRAVGCEFLAILRKKDEPKLGFDEFQARKLALQIGIFEREGRGNLSNAGFENLAKCSAGTASIALRRRHIHCCSRRAERGRLWTVFRLSGKLRVKRVF